MAKSPEVQFLEEHLKRPLFNIDDYGFILGFDDVDVDEWDPTGPPEESNERLMAPEYRKCYRLDAEGRIVALNLRSCRISDGSFLKELSALQSLDLSYNSISDGSFLKGLSALQSLNLESNGIRDGSFLKELSALQSLNLRNIRISDWSFLKELSALQSLNLRNIRISDWSFLKDLSALQSLNLESNGISDWSFLKELSALQSLNLESNGIRDGSFLKELSALQSLNLRNIRISDWSFLKELSALQSLNLESNGISDGSFLKELSALQSLNLESNGISDGSFLKELSALQSLNLRNIRISDWSFLKELSALQSLNLSYNRISDGSFLKELSALQSLNLSYNRISDGSFLKELSALQSLNLSYNRISDGSFLKELSALQSLNLRNNRISDWSFLKELSALQSLNLRNNRISDWSFLKELSALQSLNLESNSIRDLGPLLDLKWLRTLGLRRNEIQQLPAAILELGMELEGGENAWLPGSVNWAGNPIESPPRETLERGHAEVVEWFAAQAESVAEDDEALLGEMKITLVGDGGAGKTTLRKRLRGDEVPPEEPVTKGIEIHDWKRKIGNQEILAHIWDFGGQEIMHATHQFFFSRRCVYVLMLDARKDRQQDEEYWLQLIKSFGGGAPVVVALNHIDANRGYDVNQAQLREKFPFIIGFQKTALKGKREGLPEVRKLIDKAIREVEFLETRWPGPFFRVKQELERLDEEGTEFLDYKDYVGICEKFKVTKPERQQLLVGFLHDLGIVLHFHEDVELLDTQVISPEWATHGVYRIVNADELTGTNGVLQTSELAAILEPRNDGDPVYPREKHRFVVGLMKKFQLCYPVARTSEGEDVLVPDRLPVNEPKEAAEIAKAGELRFRFRYEFLPRSILPRFLVATHRDIKENLVWRTGAVLEDEPCECVALVRADLERRTIDVTVNGTQRREFFAVIWREFRRIHETFRSLPVKEEILYFVGGEDVEIDYEFLQTHVKRGWETFRTPSGAELPVDELLNGVTPPEEARDRPPMIWDVFLSHNSKDKSVVRDVAARLKKDGVSVWFDEERILCGDSIPQKVWNGLENSQRIVMFLSKDGIESNWVKRETDSFIFEDPNGANRSVLPVRLDDSQIPKHLKPIKFVEWSKKDAYEQLLAAIRG